MNLFESNSFKDQDNYVTIYFFFGEDIEIANYQPVTTPILEIKELFRCAAEASPQDIIKFKNEDKFLNISSGLLENKIENAYNLQIVGAHPASTEAYETNRLDLLESRMSTLEFALKNFEANACIAPCVVLKRVKQQVKELQCKLQTIEHLSWLGFYNNEKSLILEPMIIENTFHGKKKKCKKEVREKFFQKSNVTISSCVREWLRSPTFDTCQWEDEELLVMLQAIFIELELPQKFNIPLSVLRNFLFEVYNNYNEVSFHNFRHCFCVAQMMYTIISAVDLSSKIKALDILVLIVSCICHDLDHPGYNNIYQINSGTELALRYNDISPLENHHCSVAFRILELQDCNIFESLDSGSYRIVREGIIRCILATDMARHNEILSQFSNVVFDFNYTNENHINLLSMILIKVADISNEARPMEIAEPWLDRLLLEFFKQSDAEKLEGLPVTPFMDREKVTKPSSQCSFIGLVLLPLFEILGQLFPEMEKLMLQPVRFALNYYKYLNETMKDNYNQNINFEGGRDAQVKHKKNRKSISSSYSDYEPDEIFKASSSIFSHNFIKTSPNYTMISENHRDPKLLHKNTLQNLNLKTHNLKEIDSEIATEVEISEKTLKFKISTDNSRV